MPTSVHMKLKHVHIMQIYKFITNNYFFKRCIEYLERRQFTDCIDVIVEQTIEICYFATISRVPRKWFICG